MMHLLSEAAKGVAALSWHLLRLGIPGVDRRLTCAGHAQGYGHIFHRAILAED